MKEQNLQAVKIFVFLFLVFASFGHWIGDNDDTYLDLTASMAERGDFSLDPNQSHSKTENSNSLSKANIVNIDGSYFSTKAPLTSFLALPAYFTLDFVKSEPYLSNSYLESFKRSFNDKVSWARYLGILTVSSLSGASTGVLIFLIFQQLGLGQLKSSLAALGGAFSTLIFPYSTTMHGIMLGTLFFSLAAYLWIRSDYKPSEREIISITCSLGLGISSSYFIAFPSLILIGLMTRNSYSTHKEELYSNATYIFGGFLLGLSPLLLYNTFLFGNPFDLTIFHLNSTGLELNILEKLSMIGIAAFRSLLGPLKGLFLYSPILIFGLYGLKKTELDRNLRQLIFGSFLISVLAASLINNWLPETYFGAIYLLPASVLLTIPSFKLFFESQISQKLKFSFMAAWLFSTLSMLSSTQPWRSVSYLGSEEYLQNFFGQVIIQNDLFYYISNILREGLQSPILSYLTGATSSFNPVLSSYPFRTVLLTTQLDSITVSNSTLLFPALLGFLGLLIFRKDIVRHKSMKLLKIGLIAVILLGISGFSQEGTVFKDFYQYEDSENVRWGHESPRILFYSNGDEEKLALIKFSYRTLGPSQKLNVSLNDEQILSENTTSETDSFSELVNLKPGLNELSLKTADRCRVTGKYYNNKDTRCVSVGISDSSVIFQGDKELYNGKNVFETSHGYNLRKNSSFYIEGEKTYSLSFDARSIGGNTTLKIYRDGGIMDTTRIDAFGTNYSTPYFKTDEFSKIELETGCPRNCENIEVSDIDLKAFEEHSEDNLYDFGRNWYRKAPNERHRWSMGNSTIHIFNYKNNPITKHLWVRGRSFGLDRNITYLLNGKEVGTREVSTKDYKILEIANGRKKRDKNKQRLRVTLDPGPNKLEIKSNTDCSSIGKFNNNNDLRCGLYGFQNLYLTNP